VPRTLLLALVLTACSGNASSDKELGDIRAELTDQRAEMRAMRQEIRELRDEIHKTAPTADEAESEPAVEPPAAPPPPAGSTPPATPGKPAKPPAQGSVNIEVQSNPAGAAVFVAEKKVGVTPVIIKTPVGSSEISVRLEKSGYRPRLMTLRPEEDTKISVQLAKKSE
jgi:hypothetical protein